MLTLIKDNPLTWVITCNALKSLNFKGPQGFSLHVDLQMGEHRWWTSDEEAAFLFFKKFKLADEQTKTYFEKRLIKQDYLYNLSSATDSTKQFLCPQGLEYRPHQKAGIEYCLLTANTLIADEQRTGKTPTTLGVINNLPDAKKILILCPKTAKFGWLAECKRWLIKPYKIQVVDAQTEVDVTSDIFIVNYDILHIKTALQRMQFDLLVGDEIHLVKNQDARRSKFFFSLKAKKKIGLSGTPLLNKPNDLLTVLKWLDPYYEKFIVDNNRFVSKCGINLSLDDVQDITRSTLMLRRVQAQVFSGEPTERRLIPLSVDDDVKPLIKAELSKIQDYTEAKKQLGLSKVRHALNYIDAYDGEKIVVFAYHRGVIERLSASLGNKAVAIYGDSTDKDRKLAVERFNNDDTCTIFIGSIPAASMALNLSVSSHILFVECDWSNGLMAQAEERCSDKLQTKQVLIEYLVYEDSLDYYILSKIDYKNTVASKAVDVLYH